jgi:large subunit ribosomal protein L3
MNTNPGILGLKIGMSQVIGDDGEVRAVTVIDVKAVVVGKRTKEKNGYDALVLGYGERKGTRTSKPLAGQYKNSGTAPKRVLREFRCDAAFVAQFELGQVVPVEQVFQVGQFIDVRGVSRGRGFSGVMRRHHFAGSVTTHGSHEYKRHGGSIGTNMTPGRVLPGIRMPGQLGNKRVSVLSQKVVQILPEKGLILIAGGAPGSRNSYVELRGGVKKKNGGK